MFVNATCYYKVVFRIMVSSSIFCVREYWINEINSIRFGSKSTRMKFEYRCLDIIQLNDMQQPFWNLIFTPHIFLLLLYKLLLFAEKCVGTSSTKRKSER